MKLRKFLVPELKEIQGLNYETLESYIKIATIKKGGIVNYRKNKRPIHRMALLGKYKHIEAAINTCHIWAGSARVEMEGGRSKPFASRGK